MVDKAAPLATTASGESRRLAAFLALVAGAVGMGASPIFVRVADVGPFASAFWRIALALPFLWAWTVLEQRWQRAPRLDRRTGFAIVAAGLFFAGDLFFWHLSILNTTVANATFLATTAPVVVIIGAWALLREPVTGAILCGLGLCLAGAGALIGSSFAYAPGRLLGDLFGLATACFFGAYFIAMRDARMSIGTARLSFLTALVTGAALLVIALGWEDRILPGSIEGWAILVGLALISQVAGQGLLAFALGHLPAGFSSLVIFLEAVAAAALGWLLLGEALAPLQAAGGVLILAGIYVARPRPGGVSRC